MAFLESLARRTVAFFLALLGMLEVYRDAFETTNALGSFHVSDHRPTRRVGPFA
jgi:hypothetical protein